MISAPSPGARCSVLYLEILRRQYSSSPRAAVPIGRIAMIPIRTLSWAHLLLLGVGMTTAVAQEMQTDSVYRVDPNSRELVVVPADELKPGFVYKYFHRELGRHVWGIAKENGGFEYAFGPGTQQSTQAFDLRISELQAQALVNERVPGLVKAMKSTGRNILLQLGEDDQWSIYPSSSIPKVFDLETSRRWEWHGDRRVGVMHTHGYSWQYRDGKHYPAGGVTYGYVVLSAGASCPCH